LRFEGVTRSLLTVILRCGKVEVCSLNSEKREKCNLRRPFIALLHVPSSYLVGTFTRR